MVEKDIDWSDYRKDCMPMTKDSNNSVNSPAHYNIGSIECIDYIEDQRFEFHLGNAIKYIARARYKGKYVEDLKKAKWYLDRAIINYQKGYDDSEQDHQGFADKAYRTPSDKKAAHT